MLALLGIFPRNAIPVMQKKKDIYIYTGASITGKPSSEQERNFEKHFKHDCAMGID